MDIIKSPNDKNNYHTFELKNKLKVFLEENTKIQISCVMIVVKIGYTVDKFNGMAHFLEHMLFNGTEKYPEEKFFSEFITKNGGHTNAFTTHNHTCYYYTIDSDFLEESLQIFSQFFICPLFKKDTVSREREAVNSEHEKNINDDDWRFQNVLKNACNPDNPYKNFSTGSNSTLDIKNIDEEIRSMFNLYYSSDLMTLFVITNKKIDTVKTTIETKFNKITIKNKTGIPKNNLKLLESPKSIYVVPVADISKISFHWEIPSLNNQPHKNPTNFILYLLNHQGKNTMYDMLIDLGYIIGLQCYIYEKVGDSSILTIDITLSDTGEEHQNDVINIVFSYIEIIKSAFHKNDKHIVDIYNEQQKLNNYFFQFPEQYNPETKCMQYYEIVSSYEVKLKYLLVINYLNETFLNIKENAISILNELSDHKCISAYTSEKYKNISNMTDKNYGTKYLINNEKINVTMKNVANLKLPPLNKYMSFGKTIISNPDFTPIKKNVGYLFKSKEFENPNVNINLKIYLPLSTIDSEIYTKTLSYFSSILLNVRHELYMCETAGYDIDLAFDMGTLNIEIEGNYKMLREVCHFFVKSLKNPNFTKDEFNKVIYSLEQNDTNLIFDAPHTRVSNYFNKNTLIKFYTNSDRLLSYKKIKYENVINLNKYLFNLGTFDLLITGNCDEITYNKLENILIELQPHVLYSPNNMLKNILKKNNLEIIKIKKENPNEKNNAVGTYLYIANISNFENIKLKCMLNVIHKFMSHEYFYQLRTQEKFGYIVGSSIVSQQTYKSNELYFRFIVQSSKKSIDEMIERTNKFILTFLKKIKNIKEKEFNEIIKACIKVTNENPSNLSDLANKKMTELYCGLNKFNSSEIIENCYRNLTIYDVQLFYIQTFVNNKKMFVCV